MRNGWSGLLALSLSVVLLTGCVVSVGGNRGSGGEAAWQQAERENREAIARLANGMYIEDVRRKMGTPDFLESLTVDGVPHQVLFYRTHRVRADGQTTRDETTPLIFEDGFLIGWGEVAWRELTGMALAAR